MPQMNINTKNKIFLSAKSFAEYAKQLELTKKQILDVAVQTANRTAKEALKQNYEGVVVEEAKLEGYTAKAKVKSTNEIDTYREFGTGLVGSQNPHIDAVLEKAGWRYDVNKHGEKGWIYPKKDGTYGWTTGQMSQKKFYLACERAKEKMPEIAANEFKKIK